MACGFWDAFWPNLWSTLAGVGAGVPLALWINRRAVEHQDARAKAEGVRRLQAALEGVSAAGKHNLDLLIYARDQLLAGMIITGFAANISTWEVLKPHIVEHLGDLSLKVRLARFYEELTLFSTHIERLVAFTYSAGAALGDARKMQLDLLHPLKPFASRLIDDAIRLQSEVDAILVRSEAAPREGGPPNGAITPTAIR